MTKKAQINVRLPEAELNDYMQTAAFLDIPFSQIAREAVREKMAKLKETHPRLREQVEEIGLNK